MNCARFIRSGKIAHSTLRWERKRNRYNGMRTTTSHKRRTRLMRGAMAAVAKSNWSHIADFQIGKEWIKRSYIIYCSNAMRIECIVSQYKIRCIYFVNTKYWRMRTISLLLQPGTIRYCQLTCIVCVVRMAWQQNRKLIRKGNLSVLIFVVIHFIGWLRFYFLSFTRSIGSR